MRNQGRRRTKASVKKGRPHLCEDFRNCGGSRESKREAAELHEGISEVHVHKIPAHNPKRSFDRVPIAAIIAEATGMGQIGVTLKRSCADAATKGDI